MARISDTERLIWEQHATITDLRARLSEAEAERDRLAALVAEYRAESNETWTTIRARAEAAEAERDALRDEIGNLTMHDAAVEWRKAEAKLAAVARVRDWMVENNDDAEYDLVIVALNNILEGGGRD